MPLRRPLRLAPAALLALVALALGPAPLPAQEGELATVDLTVTDSATRAPVVGARITASGLQYTAVSDATGRVRLRDLTPGRHTVTVVHPVYGARQREVQLAAGQTLTLGMVLGAGAVALDAVLVEGRSARLQEFYQRVDGNTGYFVTREQIERRRPRRFTEIFRGIPNVRVVNDGGRTRLRMGRSMDQRDCPPVYYLDGVRLSGGSLDQDLRPEMIEGVEVYSGGQVPGRFRASDAACGVVLIWTRDRV